MGPTLHVERSKALLCYDLACSAPPILVISDYDVTFERKMAENALADSTSTGSDSTDGADLMSIDRKHISMQDVGKQVGLGREVVSPNTDKLSDIGCRGLVAHAKCIVYMVACVRLPATKLCTVRGEVV